MFREYKMRKLFSPSSHSQMAIVVFRVRYHFVFWPKIRLYIDGERKKGEGEPLKPIILTLWLGYLFRKPLSLSRRQHDTCFAIVCNEEGYRVKQWAHIGTHTHTYTNTPKTRLKTCELLYSGSSAKIYY